MYRVELYARVRRACHVEGMSTREASRVFGVDRKTVRKMLSFSVPPGYRRSAPPRRPKLGPFTGIIDRILEDDRTSHRKQRHTAKRIFDRLRDEYGFTGGYTIVKDYVREQGLRSREVFVPLSHSPGHAQAAYGHREVLIRGYVDEVVISCGAEVIARHRRSHDSEDLIFDPLHYLPLIEQKIGALDQAAPLAGWDLPEAFITLRRLLEARMGKAGKREYVQVLRLLETFRLEEVEGAVGDALRLGAIGFDAGKHLVLCRIERRPPRLNLDVYPYLPRARVAMTSAKSYMSLLSGLGA